MVNLFYSLMAIIKIVFCSVYNQKSYQRSGRWCCKWPSELIYFHRSPIHYERKSVDYLNFYDKRFISRFYPSPTTHPPATHTLIHEESLEIFVIYQLQSKIFGHNDFHSTSIFHLHAGLFFVNLFYITWLQLNDFSLGIKQ